MKHKGDESKAVQAVVPAEQGSGEDLAGLQKLGEAPAEVPVAGAELKALLKPYSAEDMTLWPVDKRVGNVKNDDPSLAEALVA